MLRSNEHNGLRSATRQRAWPRTWIERDESHERLVTSGEQPIKIATYNVNGINGRLAVLLRWLELTERDVLCMQELKVR